MCKIALRQLFTKIGGEEMVTLTNHGVMLSADGSFSATEDAALQAEGKTKTMAYQV